MNKKKLLTLIAVIIAAVLLYIFYSGIQTCIYGEKDEKTRSDAAIVLGAATYDGELSPVYRERANHGIDLYKNGYVKKIIFTGGLGEGNSISDAQAAKEYAVKQGIPSKDIIIEDKSTITQENIEYSNEIMTENNLESAIIVSDPLHMKRAMLMAKDYGIKAYSSPTPTTRYISLKSKIPFLLRELFFYMGYKAYRIIF